MEVDISSLCLNSVGSNQSTGVSSDVVSPQDVAWADSCLITDEISENGWKPWNYQQDALIMILGSKSDSSAAKLEDFSPYSREVGASQILDARTDDVLMSDEEAESFSGDQVVDDNTTISRSRFNLKNVFLPTYNEKLRDLGTKGFEDFKFRGLMTEESTGDIFKVWNLDVPAEEDEFDRQLNKAVSESFLEPTPSVSDDSECLKGGYIDDIISGIADLSLNNLSM